MTATIIMTTNIITTDGFSWTRVNETAKNYWNKGIELYVVYDDESESLIESLEDLEDHISHNRNVCVETALANTPINIVEFIKQAKTDGGGSYNLTTGYTNPNKGYMVSIEGCEEIHKDFPTDKSIRDYVLTHSELLAMDDKYLGIWYNDKKQQWYLDVSINIDNRDKAISFGNDNKQEAIWDCNKGEEIKLADVKYTFARRCDYCFEGMNAGWIVDGDTYIKHEETALAIAKSKGHASIEEAYEHDEMYYTEWEIDKDEYYVSNKPDGSFAWLVTTQL